MMAYLRLGARKRLGATSLPYGAALVMAGVGFGWFLSAAAHRGIFGTRIMPAGGSGSSVLAVPSRGYLGDALFKQGLSHIVFHEDRVKKHLAALVAPTDGTKGAVAVVGVEFGSEVEMFANEGYTVHAFEPMPMYHSLMAAKIRKNAAASADGSVQKWDVRLHHIAAGSERNGSLKLKYHTEAADEQTTVRVGRIEDYIKQELVVLSVDIQGSEIDALRGAKRLINDEGVRSLWVEIFPCNNRVLEVFQLLDENYVMFDFVPWGRPRNEHGGQAENLMNLDRHPSFMTADGAERPAEFYAFWKWMCAKKKGPYAWIQSDILAIRRDLVTPELMVKLATFSHDVYETVVQEKREQKRLEIARKKAATQPAK